MRADIRINVDVSGFLARLATLSANLTQGERMTIRPHAEGNSNMFDVFGGSSDTERVGVLMRDVSRKRTRWVAWLTPDASAWDEVGASTEMGMAARMMRIRRQ